MIKCISNENEKERIARTILGQLPEWFGLPDSTEEYISNSKRMPFWAYLEGEKPVGFIALKQTSEVTAEVYVMGVLKECQRKGIGYQLWMTFLQYARELECFPTLWDEWNPCQVYVKYIG